MNFGVGVDPAVLLGLIEERVQVAARIPADCVFLSLLPDEVHLANPPADQFVTIAPVRFPVWQGPVSGSGLLGFDAVIKTTAFARVVDQELRSSRVIRDATRGVVSLAMKVVAALHFWTPLDSSNNAQVREHIRAVSLDFRPVQLKAGPWVVCPTFWQVRFTVSLPF